MSPTHYEIVLMCLTSRGSLFRLLTLCVGVCKHMCKGESVCLWYGYGGRNCVCVHVCVCVCVCVYVRVSYRCTVCVVQHATPHTSTFLHTFCVNRSSKEISYILNPRLSDLWLMASGSGPRSGLGRRA